MDIIEVFKGEWAEIKVLMFALGGSLLFSNLDPWLGLKASIGENPAIIVYGIITALLYVLVATGWVWIDNRRVTIKPAPLAAVSMPAPIRGMRFQAGLKVEIPRGWEITDCFMTIEKELMVFYEDRVLLDPKFTEWFADKTKPLYKVLRWETPLDKAYKITIGENSNSESVLVGMIIDGTMPGANGTYVPFTTFDYCLYSRSPTTIQFGRLGLRKISLAFHWKRNGKTMPIKRFEGYLYAEANESMPKVIIGAGDYAKDSRIPTPLPKTTRASN